MAQIHALTLPFEGEPLTTLTWDGKPAWVARENASWACFAAISPAWSTEASKTSAALETMTGPRVRTRPVRSPVVASTASIRTADATSAPSSPATCAAGAKRNLPLAVILPSTAPSG